jgi:DNA-binding transcriptional LysR family regulator
MELRQLRYFVAIAEEQSFTRAAERLWITQPGLSAQIRKLEAELGVRLLERHTRGVDLTRAGEVFRERARTALTAAEIAGATGRDLEAGVVGTVRLGIATGARCRLGAALLQRFACSRPGVELTVLESYGGTLWRDLRDGRLDALIAPCGFASSDLTSLRLGAEPWTVLVGSGHRLAGVGALNAEELNGERIMVTAHRDGAALDRTVAELLANLGVETALVPAPPGPAVLAAVAAGETLALTTAPFALPPGVTSRTLAPRRTLGFELLWRAEAPSPALAEFVRLAAGCADGRPAAIRQLAVAA